MTIEMFTSASLGTHIAALSPIACLLLYMIIGGDK